MQIENINKVHIVILIYCADYVYNKYIIYLYNNSFLVTYYNSHVL